MVTSIARRKLQAEAVYGLTEFYRDKIAAARLVACPGCYPTAALLALVPLAKRETDRRAMIIVIDAKSGVTGAGRGLKQNTLFSEGRRGAVALFGRARTGIRPRSSRRSASLRARAVTVNFTPHLIPMAGANSARRYVRLNGATRGRFARGAGRGLRERAVRRMSTKRA